MCVQQENAHTLKNALKTFSFFPTVCFICMISSPSTRPLTSFMTPEEVILLHFLWTLPLSHRVAAFHCLYHSTGDHLTPGGPQKHTVTITCALPSALKSCQYEAKMQTHSCVTVSCYVLVYHLYWTAACSHRIGAVLDL